MKNNNRVFKWISIGSLALIPIAAGIGILFNINRNPIQILLMATGLLIVSRLNWLKYKEAA